MESKEFSIPLIITSDTVLDITWETCTFNAQHSSKPFFIQKSKKLLFGRQVFASFNATLAATHIKMYVYKKGLLMLHSYLPYIIVPFSMEKEIGILYSYLSTFRDNVTLFAIFFFWRLPLGWVWGLWRNHLGLASKINTANCHILQVVKYQIK